MSSSSKPGFKEVAQESQIYHPQEALLKVKSGSHKLQIGIPKEIGWQEHRIPLTPEGVAVLTSNGHEVMMEAGAGEASKYADHEFSDAGASISYSTKEVFENEIVLKIQPPTEKEIDMIKPGKILMSALQLGNLEASYFKKLASKKITAIGFEMIEDKIGSMPVVRAMSEIAGSSVMLIAAEYLSNVKNGKGVILGGITGVPPTSVVILGAGTVAEYAARTALGLGADVKIFDNRIYRLRRIKYNLGQQIFTSTLDGVVLSNSIADADVVIGALRPSHGRAPVVVTEEMISNMQANSVIIDVSIDNGGCFETSAVTSHKSPTFRKHDVIHYCVPNIASRVPRTASTAVSNIFVPYILQAADLGGMDNMIREYSWFMKGVYMYKGTLCNADIAEKYEIQYKDLDLIIMTRF